jgi:transketolase
MIPDAAKLVQNIFDEKIVRKPTRDGFGTGVTEAGREDERVVVLCADLAESTRAEWFQKEFPDRYIELGVAEQNLAGVAAGLAAYGKIPFIASYAAFNPGRNNEQIRTAIALNDVPVKVCGMHAGVSVGPDGATHQALEDVALMRVIPNMTVIVPCDAEEARKAVRAAAQTGKPCYLRFGRTETPIFTTLDTPFEIGKAHYFWKSEHPQVALMAAGSLVYQTLKAAHELASEGVETSVLNLHSIKPMDIEKVIEAARDARAVVTVEEHQILGGLGSTVAEVLVQNFPVPMEFIGVHDRFGQSGEPAELIEHYGMGVGSIKDAVRRVLGRK